MWGMLADGRWSEERVTNVFDGSAPFYCTYECADGGYVAVGALEPEFFAELLRLLELDPAELGEQRDRSRWPALRHTLFDRFRQHPRDHWARCSQTATRASPRC